MRGSRAATLAALALVAGAFVVLVAIGMTNALVYYVTPTELLSASNGAGVRVYGVVEPGSVRWQADTSTLSFRVTDGTTTLAVRSDALPSGLFRDGIGVVLAGRQGQGAFVADEVLVKHSEVYAPLAPGQTVPPGFLDAVREEDA